MTPARVLIVDDSVTMRALFSGVLERAQGIDVVGMAADANEARELMIALKPDVVTLDVEMPGMSGLEFLAEIMRDRPTPVIMLSTLTQKGAETSFQALELGAVECFPKPKSATPDEFNALAPKLAALVIAAANGKVKRPKQAQKVEQLPFDWNGNLIALCASTGGVDAALNILPALPANCPPTIMLMHMERDLAAPLADRLAAACSARVSMVRDNQPLEQGNIYLATDPDHHVVIDRWPGASLRLVPNNPINGARPSASLLFASMAKTAAAQVAAAVLTGLGTDGAAGLKALRQAGARTFVQDSATSVVDEAPAAARAAGAAEAELPLDRIIPALLDSCRAPAKAA